MAKELSLYYPIYDFVAKEVIAEIDQNMGKSCVMRVCSPGGHVRPAWGIFAKTKEHGDIHCKVDGGADSIMAFYPLYAKSSECLTQTRFVFHRADMFVENDEDQKFLDGINDDLKAQMKARIKADKWKAITKITIDELFDPNTRKDYTITGAQAVEIGLCDSCKTLTPAIQQEIEAFNKKFYQVAATTAEPSKPTKMTLSELKEKHPELFTEVKAEVKKETVAAEKDRIGAWMVFHKVDPEAVAKGIESGEPLSATKMAEFTAKMVSGAHLRNIEGENADPTKTKEQPAGKETAEAKAAKEAEAAFNKALDDLQKNKKF
jgi:ATP-dependent protease ClpP protease subunit